METDKRGWPILHSASEPCDGLHPRTGLPCVHRWHRGLHRTADGAEWLDD